MKKTLILWLVLLGIDHALMAQKQDPEAIRQAVESMSFVFEATSTTPTGGRLIQLDPGYTLALSPTQVEANLPYFGRAYQAPIGDLDAGMKFSVDRYEYKIKSKRKDAGWDLAIRPEHSDVKRIFLNITRTGKAMVTITSNSRQSITYEGTIKP